jgi:hypothetical protein
MNSSPTVDPQLAVRLDYQAYVEAHFIRLAYAEELMTIVGSGWITRSGLEAAPGEPIGRANYFHAARNEAVVRIDGAICHLFLNDRALVARVAAEDWASAERALAEIRSALPEVGDADREVPVRFWWWSGQAPKVMARMLETPAWSQTAGNYPGSTGHALASLAGWRREPPHGGRLLLLHGPPGTGKTSAVRTLTGEWRSWAEFHFITDPEQFLHNPSYLLETVGGTGRAMQPADRWKVVVLEDAGEFLVPDAKQRNGQALSRLLNVCDGVLGQSMRALVLITTNEPLAALHPALSRPGRCLADVEFELFDEAGADAWCASHDAPVSGASAASLADLYAHAAGRTPLVRRRRLGFAPA